MAGAAFTESMGLCSAPEVLLFKRFQANWKFIDLDRYEDSSTDKLAAEFVADIKPELTSFLNTALMEQLPRDDYRELIELKIIFLGTSTPRGVRFNAPGAIHQARWMAKTIYTFKVWLFRFQFHLTARKVKGLRDMCIFFT